VKKKMKEMMSTAMKKIVVSDGLIVGRSVKDIDITPLLVFPLVQGQHKNAGIQSFGKN
jgi:hypothetical protein